MRQTTLVITLATLAVASFAAGPLQPTTYELVMKPHMLDFDGNAAMGLMYMPSQLKLSSEKPPEIKKEPTYAGTPLYGVLTVGNGPRSRHAVALDESADGTPKIYIDLNANGDLTDDGDGTWNHKKPGDPSNYFGGTYIFRASWGTPDKETSSADYGLNLYYTKGRQSITYYRAGARTGKITLGEDDYRAILIEGNNDGVFAHEPNSRGSVFMIIDNKEATMDKPFDFMGSKYIASVTPDGAHLTITPAP